MSRVLLFPIVMSLFIILVDLYVYQGLKVLVSDLSESWQRWIKISFWVLGIISLLLVWLSGGNAGNGLAVFARSFIIVQYIPKFISIVFLLLDDFIRLIRWVGSFFTRAVSDEVVEKMPIGRSDFLITTGAVTAAVLVGGLSFGILSGAHNYQIHRRRIALPGLPKKFHGLKLVQISDIHSGSFWNKKAVIGGVEKLMELKPDVICFTGDLVNDMASEMKEYRPVFEKIKAPFGVYSVLGNHDYGDYVLWTSPEAKKKNLADLMETQRQMGWNLLMNETRELIVDGEKLHIVGIENWGARGRFPKYGKMDLALQGIEPDIPKILLSHDPSHWRAQVLPEYSNIGLMLAGHTHGMQFGVEIPGVKWSPVKYMYPEWAGLYQEGEQFLYVNRGFGYIGFPGRVGILPEITCIELVAG